MNKKIKVFFVLCALVLYAAPAVAVDFPGRQKAQYKGLQWIEIEELQQDYLQDRVNIVDVRSKLEYDTIHINGAVHIPVAERSFESKLKKLANDSPGKKTAFY